jgi:hypothetical protein
VAVGVRPESALRAALAQLVAARDAASRADTEIVAAHRDLVRALLDVIATIPAERIRAAFAEEITDVDRAILHGLADGLSRRSLHTRLGISRRDIDERIPRLHRLAGTTTQFQLGRAAAALGWLDSSTP